MRVDRVEDMTTPHSSATGWHRPGSPKYETMTSGFQTAYSHRPDLAVQAHTVDDVVAAISYAADRGLPVGVQNTGHGLSFPADTGILIGTSGMNGIQIDPQRATARIGAGVRAGDLVTATAEHGLAPLTGTSTSVGVVGYLLGAGVGLLARQFGYAADHVREIDLVTADGVSTTLRPGDELFAAVLGTGGNFGVVTSLEVGLVPVDRVVAGQLVFDTPLLAQALRTWLDWCPTAPTTVTTALTLVRLPNIDELPEHLRGHAVASLRVVSCAGSVETERALVPLRGIGPRLTDDVREMPFTGTSAIESEPNTPHPYAASNALLSDLPYSGAEILLEKWKDFPDTVVDLRHLGGAMSRHQGNTAIDHRRASYAVRVIAEGRDTALPESIPAVLDAVEPWKIGTHLNFVYGGADVADEAHTRAGYSAETYAWLQELKSRHDPQNRFRFNRNIPPA